MDQTNDFFANKLAEKFKKNNDNEKGGGSQCKLKRRDTCGVSNILDLKLAKLSWFYLKYESCLKTIIQKFSKTTRSDYNQNIAIFKGTEKYNSEMNFRIILDRIRLSNYESNQLDTKKAVCYHGYKD